MRRVKLFGPVIRCRLVIESVHHHPALYSTPPRVSYLIGEFGGRGRQGGGVLFSASVSLQLILFHLPTLCSLRLGRFLFDRGVQSGGGQGGGAGHGGGVDIHVSHCLIEEQSRGSCTSLSRDAFCFTVSRRCCRNVFIVFLNRY